MANYLASHSYYPLKTQVDIAAKDVKKWHDLLEPELGAKWPISGPSYKQWITGDPINSAASCPAYARLAGFSNQGLGSYGYNADGAVEARGGGEMGLGGTTRRGEIPTLQTVDPVPQTAVVAPSEMISIGDAVLSAGNSRDHPNWKFSGSSTLSPFSWPIWHALGETTPPEVLDRARKSLTFMKARHGERWNLLFADGHVENLSIKNIFNFRNPSITRRWNRDNESNADRLVVPND